MRNFYRFDACPGSDTLVVLLTSYGGHGTPAHNFEWQRAMSRYAVNKLYMIDTLQHWYQGPILGFSNSLGETIEKIKFIISSNNISRVILAGSSMGGHGALLLGGLLGANCILAFVPQANLERNWLARIGDERWVAKMNEIDKIGYDKCDIRQILEQASRPVKAKIFYGKENRLDHVHAEYLIGIPGVEIVPFDGETHEIAYHLASSGKMSVILNEAIGIDMGEVIDTINS